MKTPLFSLASLRSRSLSLSLLLAIGGCSLLCIALAIGFQLHSEYRRDLQSIAQRLQFVENSYVPALTAGAYQLDEEQVRLQLKGVLQLQDMVYARVREQLNKGAYDVEEGDPEAPGAIIREYPLVYQAMQPVPVGTLEVRASLDGVYARLKERILTIALTNALLIAPLAAAILLILQVALNRHLANMARYTASLSLDSLDQSLSLQRAPSRSGAQDELDQLVQAINGMRERIRNDMALRLTAEQELLFRKTMLECVLEARIDGICITGVDNACLFGNHHFRNLWHVPIDCLPGAPAQPIFALIEEQLQDRTAFQTAQTETRESPQAVVQGETALINGQVFEYYSVPVQDSAGALYGRLWSFRDVSQRKQLEEQLRQSRKMETLGSLAGGIAHDFNNLLSPIIGYAELGLNQLAPGDALFVDLSQILKAAARAADLTRQILAFSRKQMLEVKVIDLNDLIREFEGMVRRLIGESITVRTMLAPQPALIRADKSQIEQVVLNMAVNARDAMPEGGTLTIETAEVYLDQRYAERHVEVAAGDYVMLSISDTGVGIEEAIQDRIFEPFFTTKERGKGTGLGLATAFGVVKQHHGHLWVYSEPGHGTTFKIYLPKAHEAVSLPEAAEAETPTASSGGEHILVVEDDAMVRELVCETLDAHGYQVSEAEHPEMAMAMAARISGVDLLLTDVIMPGMNGRELHRRLSADIPGLKVLYMSGYSENVIADQGMLYEGVEFIQKPFSVRALLQKVRQALR
jgi:signal transduction histidine kinase/HAMP domain-containing protein